MNKTFKVSFTEVMPNGRTITCERTAVVPSREEVIRIYGLNEPEILDYTIEEVLK